VIHLEFTERSPATNMVITKRRRRRLMVEKVIRSSVVVPFSTSIATLPRTSAAWHRLPPRHRVRVVDEVSADYCQTIHALRGVACRALGIGPAGLHSSADTSAAAASSYAGQRPFDPKAAGLRDHETVMNSDRKGFSIMELTCSGRVPNMASRLRNKADSRGCDGKP
jgi:hypothetical protein